MHARIGWQNLRTSEFLDSGDYYLITGTDFEDGRINLSTCHYVEKDRFEQDKKIQIKNGSILITKDGTLGKVAFVENLDKPATLNAGVFNVEIIENDVDNRYLFQYLKAPFLMDYVNSKATGGTIKHLNQSILVDFPVQMPESAEQQKIGAYFSRLDHLITLHQRECFSFDFGSRSAKVAQKTISWEQREVSNVAMISTGGTPSTAINEYWNPKQVPWLSSGEVHKKYITYTDDKISNEGLNHSSARMIKQNSVLIALAGQGKTRGTVAINRISLSTNQSIAAMTFAPDICPEFVFSNLESRYDELRKVSSGDGTRGGLNKQLVSEIQIPYTSLNEQRKIGQFFTHLDRLITLHQREPPKEDKILNDIKTDTLF